MRSFLVVILIMFFAASVVQAAVPTERAVPEGVDLSKYPLFSGPLTPADRERLGLGPSAVQKLERPTVVYNYHRRLQRFVLEALPAGTVVLVDGAGTPVYKADCGNRIAPIKRCPENVGGSGNPGNNPSGGAQGGTGEGNPGPGGGSGLLDRAANSLWNGIRSVAGFLGKFFKILGLGALLLLLLAIPFLLGYALAWGVHSYRERRRGGGAGAPPVASGIGSAAVNPIAPAVVPPNNPGPGGAKSGSRFFAFYGPEKAGDPHKIKLGGGYRRATVTADDDGGTTIVVFS